MPLTASISPPKRRPGRRITLYVLAVLVAIVGLLAIAGEAYEAVARNRDEREFRRWGDLVDVGGYRLNLNCLGAGRPTVILDNGLGLPAAEWSLVQPDVAEFTRVCSYDRAGYAWSDSGPFPRTSGQIVQELHTLLSKAGVEPPYILVGHSFGGDNVRLYTHDYPNQVAGVILVDAAHEDALDRLPSQFRESEQNQLQMFHRWQPLIPVLIHAGVMRLILQTHPLVGVPADTQKEIRSQQLSARFFDAVVGETEAMPQSVAQVRSSGTLGDRPLLVLTAANAGEDLSPRLDRETFRKIWITQLQPSLARLSSHGEQVIVPDTGHMIPLQQPQAVIDAIHRMTIELRTK
jgi:pimeloyl-ACP methyl ester carboxylesterase